MKPTQKIIRLGCLSIAIGATFVACQKSNTPGEVSTQTLTTSSDLISVAAGLSSSALKSAGDSTDSIYVVQHCDRGYHRDSIASADLPATVVSYLASNYAGYTFQKAYSIENSSDVVSGYVVVITFNAKPVALEFNAAGSFVRVLEQRERGDANGKGYHQGGRFEHRDGRHRDTIAIKSLPAAITSYFATNYASDTLVSAFWNRDSTILVLSKNNGAFATVFTSAGIFVSRSALQTRAARVAVIEQSALPASVLSYLTNTYPAYVFERAFVIKPNNTVQGYVVVIDANSTKYGLLFDASGNLLRSVSIR